MATKQGLTSLLLLAAVVLPVVTAFGWTVSPAVRAWVATTTLAIEVDAYQLESAGGVSDVKRTVQNHFRNYDVYIPTTDIVAVLDGYSESHTRLEKMLRAACGKGVLYVWVPIRYRLPVIGDRISEWCWKPKVSVR